MGQNHWPGHIIIIIIIISLLSQEAHVSWLSVLKTATVVVCIALNESYLGCPRPWLRPMKIITNQDLPLKKMVTETSVVRKNKTKKRLIYSKCPSLFPGRIWCTGCLAGSVFFWGNVCVHLRLTGSARRPVPPVPVSGVSARLQRCLLAHTGRAVLSLSLHIRLHSTSVGRVVDMAASSSPTRSRRRSGSVGCTAFKIKASQAWRVRVCLFWRQKPEARVVFGVDGQRWLIPSQLLYTARAARQHSSLISAHVTPGNSDMTPSRMMHR